MHLLAAPGRAHRDCTAGSLRRRAALVPFTHARARWPLVWAALHLLGCAAGEWWAGRGVAPDVPSRPPREAWVRIGALAPALLACLPPGPADVLVWGASAASGAAWAAAEARGRRSRREACADDPWGPSRRRLWRAPALVRVSGWPDRSGDGWAAPAVIIALGRAVAGDAQPAPRPGDAVLLRGEGPAPAFGALLAGRAEAGPAAAVTVPGGFGMARFLAGRGVLWQGRWTPADAPRLPSRWPGLAGQTLPALRDGLLARLARELPAREAALLGSVLLGERDASSRANQAPFTRVGLAHLFAVSGLNVGIILGVLFTLTRPLRPGVTARCALAALVLPAYAVLTGLTGSVLRACGLGLLVLACPLAGRRLDPLHLLGVLFWLNVQAQPWSVLDTGCRLSYLAAAGLAVAVRGGAPLWRAAPARWRWLPLGLAVTLGAQWFTLPDTAASFGWVHLLSPLVNLYAVPLFSAIVWLASLALLAAPLCRWIAEAIFANCWLLARLFEVSTAALDAALPLQVGVPALGPLRLGGLLLASGLTGRGLAALGRAGDRHAAARAAIPVALGAAAVAALLPCGRAAPAGRMTAVQFATGQGDCAALVFPDRSAVVVDTGPPLRVGAAWERSAGPWLAREGVRGLAAVVLTHAHDDHTGGVGSLRARHRVGAWWLGGACDPQALGLPAGSRARRPAAGDTVHAVGAWALVCAHPVRAAPPPLSENDASIALALCHAGRPVALWTGDLETGGERSLLAAAPWAAAPLQFWKAGHHGSRTSGSGELLARIQPALVAVSCGVANRHRHPSHGPFAAGGDTFAVVRTDLDGTLALAWRGDGALDWRTTGGRRGRVAPPS